MVTSLHEVARVDTPLGPVLLRIREQNGNATHMSIAVTIRDGDPQLPDGMRVDRCVVLDLGLAALDDGAVAYVELALEGDTAGSPETGEWLESIAFEGAAARINIATRDAAWMLSYGPDHDRVPVRLRADNISPTNAAWRVAYTPRGLTVTTASLAKGEMLNCPFAIAFVSAPDVDPASTWFAVDGVLP